MFAKLTRLVREHTVVQIDEGMENVVQKTARTLLVHMLDLIGDRLLRFPFLHPLVAGAAQDEFHQMAHTLRENPWAPRTRLT